MLTDPLSMEIRAHALRQARYCYDQPPNDPDRPAPVIDTSRCGSQTSIEDGSKVSLFRALHERDGTFVIPNPWDVGTARVLAALGFEALATTSAGHAYSLGLPEGTVPRAEVLKHCTAISAATDLPVSADLEKDSATRPNR
jgi:hypothetical protein